MPRAYKRKTDRGTTPRDIFELAASEVKEGRSLRGAAETYGIHRMTLLRFIRKSEGEEIPNIGYEGVGKAQQILTPDMDVDLAKHVMDLADMFYGLTPDKLRSLAYEFATLNNVKMPDSWERDNQASELFLNC